MIRASVLALATVVALGAAAPSSAQRPKRKKDRCTVCDHDPELLAKNGMNHGPFIFGRSDTTSIEQDLSWRPVWLESEFIRMGAMLPSWKVPEEDRKAYRAILTELREKWPDIDPRRTTLDRWLRAHLLADRAEKAYAEFSELMRIPEGQFEDEEWLRMRGIGKYLGEKDKYEVMVFEYRAPYKDYMSVTWGLTYVKPQRWNNVDRTCMWFGMNLQDDDVRHDQHLHNMVRHNLAHNMLDGYMFYSYDLPVWITEGFAHWFERRNDPRFNMFDTIEGSFHEAKALERWAPEVRKIVLKGESASFASLLRRASYAEIDWEDHLICWSKIDFLIQTQPENFAKVVEFLKTRRNEKGLPDNSDMDGAQREAFKEFFGWTMIQAEREWKEWVLSTYPVK